MSETHPNNKKKKYLNSYARYSSIAFQMLAIILLGIWGGVKLDEWVQFQFPVFTLILSFVSVGMAIYVVIKDLIKK